MIELQAAVHENVLIVPKILRMATRLEAEEELTRFVIWYADPKGPGGENHLFVTEECWEEQRVRLKEEAEIAPAKCTAKKEAEGQPDPMDGVRPANARHIGVLPMKAPGCPMEFWSGVIGISDKLVAFDGEMPACEAKALTKRGRQALARYMVDRWTRFGEAR